MNLNVSLFVWLNKNVMCCFEVIINTCPGLSTYLFCSVIMLRVVQYVAKYWSSVHSSFPPSIDLLGHRLLYKMFSSPAKKQGSLVIHSLSSLINTKCDGTPPRSRATGEGKHSAALKQNQIVEIWGVFTQPAPGLHRSHPSV